MQYEVAFAIGAIVIALAALFLYYNRKNFRLYQRISGGQWQEIQIKNGTRKTWYRSGSGCPKGWEKTGRVYPENYSKPKRERHISDFRLDGVPLSEAPVPPTKKPDPDPELMRSSTDWRRHQIAV